MAWGGIFHLSEPQFPQAEDVDEGGPAPETLCRNTEVTHGKTQCMEKAAEGLRFPHQPLLAGSCGGCKEATTAHGPTDLPVAPVTASGQGYLLIQVPWALGVHKTLGERRRATEFLSTSKDGERGRQV